MFARHLRNTLFACAVMAAPAATLAKSHATDIAARTLTTTEPASVGFAPDRLALLNSAMHRAVDTGRVAGVMTMLVRHGKVVNFDVYGQDSIARNTPLKRDAIFRLYSQTKPLTGVAMMMLFEQGKWQLSDPIDKYIPEFAHLKVFAGLDRAGKPILEEPKHKPTMAMLMTHTAGFAYGLGEDDDSYVGKQYANAGVWKANGLHEAVTKIAAIPLLYQPGTKWVYSASVDIQGYIVEKLSGQPFGQFLANNLFTPLGMGDTGFYTPAEKATRLAAMYAPNRETHKLVELSPARNPRLQDFTQPPNLESGGGGAVSTIDDYARFCQMLLNDGAYNGARILAPATVALLRSDHFPLTSAQEDDTYGGTPVGGPALGFGMDVAVIKDPARMGSLAGKGSFYWGGAAGTWFWIDPQNDLFFLGMIQNYGPEGDDLSSESQSLVYGALTEPAR